MGAMAEALHAEADDVRDQLRAVFDALLQQRLVEHCPPCTLPRLKTPVRGQCPSSTLSKGCTAMTSSSSTYHSSVDPSRVVLKPRNQ